jgi:hypothetical protein
MANVRGTPCDHFEFHHNRSCSEGNSDTLGVTTAPHDNAAAERCTSDGTPTGDPFVPNPPSVILQTHDNEFKIDNPLNGGLAVGDFDGDGREDVFVATGVTWWSSPAGTAEWRLLNRMPQLVSELRFGDFDDDGRTDVVGVYDDHVVVSWAGASKWFPLNSSSLPGDVTVEDLAVGQFDSDPRADLFFGDGTTWWWASGGTSGGWSFFAFSGYRVPELRFGDFTGDGLTDVFRVAPSGWEIVTGVGGSWTPHGPAQLPDDIHQLVIADFDSDGIADVGTSHLINLPSPYPHYFEWLMSPGGTGAASVFHVDFEQPIFNLPIGDFDGVPGDDVLRWDDELWFGIISSSLNERWSRQAMR